MKKIVLSLLLLLPLSAVHAQAVMERVTAHADQDSLQPNSWDMGLEPAADTLRLPLLNPYGQLPAIGRYPMTWGSLCDWQLHEGLNVSLGASVFTSLGSHAYPGTGFGQNVAMMYAAPINSHLSIAVGGYLNNLSWGRSNFRDAGLTAVLGYRLNERWEAFVYGQKSLNDNFRLMPPPLYDMSELGDRIGAAVRYHVSPSVSIQVAVERRERPSLFHPLQPQAVQHNADAAHSHQR